MMPDYLLAASYHRRPVAACYNSFLSGLQSEIQRLAEKLPDRRAAHALAALGFQSLRVKVSQQDKLLPLLEDGRETTLLGRTAETALYELHSRPTTQEFAALARASVAAEPRLKIFPDQPLTFSFQGRPGPVFRHPDPIQPSALILRWRDTGGGAALQSSARELLPVALAPHDRVELALRVDKLPPPGTYQVDLVRALEPERVLGSQEVEVLAQGPPASSP